MGGVVGLEEGDRLAIGMTGLSVLAILYSSTQLIREARYSLEVIEAHLKGEPVRREEDHG
ncbi:MAG: hypothetical protein ACE5FP_04575 [Gemmatimonadota bacterium]